MNKEQILKIIDDLTKNNKKLRVKDLTNDEAIFVHFGAVKFLCDFETGPLKLKSKMLLLEVKINHLYFAP